MGRPGRYIIMTMGFAEALRKIYTDVHSVISGEKVKVTSVNQPAASLGHGVKTITTPGSDEALAANTPCQYVVVQAQKDNTGIIAIGASGVDATIATGTGIILEPGDTFTLNVDNLADVYVDSVESGDGVRFTYGVV